MEISSVSLQLPVDFNPPANQVGPPPALEAIYRTHAGFVWRTLRRLGLPEADARDASQEVFLTLHRTLPTFEGRCAISSWLYAICRSVARDARCRAYRRHEVGEEDARAIGRTEVPAEPTPLTITEEKQRFGVLLAILEELDVSQREVFALFELEGLRGNEIAEMLAIPLGTVHSRLRLARHAFREACARFQAAEQFVERAHPTRISTLSRGVR